MQFTIISKAGQISEMLELDDFNELVTNSADKNRTIFDSFAFSKKAEVWASLSKDDAIKFREHLSKSGIRSTAA
tara:strand:+ start:83 stop:304 length:222 start_codon:yes stop_codon:yes gene_type:complete